MHENLEELQQKYKRQTKCKNCLVLEPVGLLLNLIDPTSEAMSLFEGQSDAQIKQINYNCEGINYVAMIRIWSTSLVK